MTAPAPIVEMRRVGVRLARDGREHWLVRDVWLRLEEGRTVALVGESGSGKSLTAACLIRLFGPNGRGRQLRPAGEILYRCRDGRQVDLLTLDERSMEDLRGRDIGFIAQDPLNALNPTMRVGDQAAEARRRHLGESRAAAAAAVLGLFSDVGFADPSAVAPLYPHQLSGGMKQRVMIAVALAAEPRLVIADEPTTALDVTIQRQVLETLARLQRERNLAMLFISHDLHVVARIADRVAVMYCGGIVEDGPADAVFGQPAHPYTADLIASVPVLERLPRRLNAISGVPADPLRRPDGCPYAPRCGRAATACAAPVARVTAGDDRSAACIRPLAVAADTHSGAPHVFA
jgi:oligopeptide/dipeptide ABC transporter ATP-binding protein